MDHEGGQHEIRRSTLPGVALVSQLPGPLLGLLAVLGLFIALLASREDGADLLGRFLSLGNLQSVLHRNTVTGVIALGALLVIISGGIDLSVGSIAALVTVVTMQVFNHMQARTGSWLLATYCAIPAGIGVGGLCGLTNGILLTRLRVNAFVVTLGMMSIARGLAYWLAERTQITFKGDRPPWVDVLASQRSEAFVFDPGVWSLLLLALIMAVVLHFTIFGRYTYAIGSNEATARLCGVPIERWKVAIYTLSGLLTGWAGVLLFAHTSSGNPGAAVGLELGVIAAVVIGGASLTGGQGTVLGTLLGALILGILENGVSFFDVPIEVKHILIGVIIIVNTALSRWQRRQGD